MTVPRSYLSSSGTVTGDQFEDGGGAVEGALAGSGDGEEGVGKQADRGPAVPEVQVVTWSLSRPAACFASW